MPPGERREYAGNAPPTTLASGIDNATLTIPLTNGTGWPTGAVGPFFIVIDKGQTTEEKVKVASRTGDTLTVQAGGRGQDGTSAATHSIGASVEHVVTADDMNMLNQHVADPTLDHHTQYLNTARHSVGGLHGTAMMDMAALLDAVWPAGTLLDTGGAVPTTETTTGRRDWLACDGAAVSRTTYSRLFGAIGTTYGAGDGTATFNVPDFRGRVAIASGTGTGLTARANGQTVGTETVALAVANMPSHSHTVNSHSHAGATGLHDVNHWHGLGGHTHGGNQHDHNIQHWHPAHIANVKYLAATVAHSHGGGAGVTAEASSPNDGFGGTVAVNVESAANGAPNGLNRSGWIQNSGNTGGPSGNSDWVGGGGTQSHSHTIPAEAPGTNAQGSGTAINIMQPGLVVTKMIKS